MKWGTINDFLVEGRKVFCQDNAEDESGESTTGSTQVRDIS